MATIVNVQDPSTSNNLAVDSSGRIGVNNWPAVQTIQGTVNVALFPSVQPVSGNVDVTDRSLRQLGIVTIASGGVGTNTAPGYTIIQDPTSNTHKMAINADGSINVSGTISASNPSVSATGAAVPASATYLGANKSGNITGLALDGSGNLNVNVQAGTITASNPSVGTDGSAIPTSSTLIGASDGTNLQQLLVESSSNRNLRTGIYSGANEATVTGANALKVDNSAVTQPILAASLPLPTGASTSAKQPALGTAGVASTDVITVQGIAAMTAIKVDGSGVTQPVSGTISVNALPTGSNTIGGVKLIDTGGTNVASISAGGAVKVDNSGVTQPVSGTITANVGTTNGLALDTSVNGVIVAQGSTTSGEKGPLVQGAVTTGSPTYTTAQTSPISLTTAGAVRVDASATTQPVSGTVTSNAGTGNFTVVQTTGSNLHAVLDSGSTTAVTQATGANLHTVVDSGSITVSQGTGSNLHTVLDSGSTTAVTQATGTNLHTVVDSGSITANAGTNLNTSLLALESGGNLASIKTYTSAFADTSTSGTVTNDGDVVSIVLPGGQATALIQIITSNLNGTLLFEGSPDSGTTYYSTLANQIGTSTIAASVVGTGGSQAAGAWRANVAGFTNFHVRLHPASSGTATIKLILTQGVHNVAINNATTLGQTTSTNSAPVVPASDYISPVKSSRLEIAGQGTGVVNAQNTDLIPSTDVTGYTCAVLQLQGTWSLTLQAQQSNDNSNFYQVQIMSAQTLVSNTGLLNTVSGNGLYVVPLTGRYLRVRATAFTSNSSLVGTLELYTTPPPFAFVAAATYATLAPQTSGGTTDFHLISAATTNATNVKASQGQVYGWNITNTNAATRYVKFHNTSGTPTAGTGVVRTVGVPAGGYANFTSIVGIPFSTGIGITTVTGTADNDTTAVGANDLTIDIDYK